MNLPQVVIVLLAVIAIVALVVWATGRKYKRIFSDAHILEIWSKTVRAKAAALEELTQPSSGAPLNHEPGGALSRGTAYTTGARLAFMYTIDRHNDKYSHHISMSNTRGVLAWAAARFLTALFSEILSVDLRLARIWRSERTIYHVAFELGEEDEQRFVTTPVVVPDSASLLQIRQRLRLLAQELGPTASSALE